jgi:hypothetical protein
MIVSLASQRAITGAQVISPSVLAATSPGAKRTMLANFVAIRLGKHPQYLVDRAALKGIEVSA